MGYETKLYWDGEIPRIQTKEKLIEWLKQFPNDKWFSLVVEPIGDLNNSKQQKLYHKWCDILASEYGWNSGDEMHQYLKGEYNGGKSTRGFDMKQWSEYMIKVQVFANENNINLPTGE